MKLIFVAKETKTEEIAQNEVTDGISELSDKLDAVKDEIVEFTEDVITDLFERFNGQMKHESAGSNTINQFKLSLKRNAIM